jgi:hypothetical protein
LYGRLSFQYSLYKLSVLSSPVSNLVATSTGVLPCENSLKAFVSLYDSFHLFIPLSPTNSSIFADMSKQHISISLAISRMVCPVDKDI